MSKTTVSDETETEAPAEEGPGKVHIADVSLTIGMLSALGGIYTIPKANAGAEEAVKLVCPDCEEPHEFPSQKYVCNDDETHGPFAQGEMAVGRKVDDKIVKVDRDAVKEARASVLPDKELELQVHNRAEVEAATFPKGNAYVFVPKGKSVLPPILLELLKKRRDLCLIAKTNLRKADHLVMVDVELNDQLVIREMMWPEDMKHFPQVETEKIDKKNLTMAETLLEASVEPFDPKEYAKDSRARVAEIVDAAAGGATSPTKKAAKKKDTTQQDLSALLEAAIAAKKAS